MNLDTSRWHPFSHPISQARLADAARRAGEPWTEYATTIRSSDGRTTDKPGAMRIHNCGRPPVPLRAFTEDGGVEEYPGGAEEAAKALGCAPGSIWHALKNERPCKRRTWVKLI